MFSGRQKYPVRLGGGPRGQLAKLLFDGNTVANFQPGNFTGTLNASAWANSIGAAPSLAQATGGNQPIIVSADYVPKAYLPGVLLNDFSTPDAAANRITTGTLRLEGKIALNNYNTVLQDVVSKWDGGATKRAWLLRVDANKLVFAMSSDGTDAAAAVVTSSTTLPSASGVALYVACDYVIGTGVATFYTSSDGVTYSQLGTVQNTGANAIYNGAGSSIRIGSRLTSGGALNFTGGVYRVTGKQNGAAFVDFNAADWPEISTNGATQASSTTGEVWTLNNTATANPAAIVRRPTLGPDGSNDNMVATYTATQPRTIYLVGRMHMWTAGKYVMDGVSANTLGLSKTTGSPKLSINAGSAAAENAGFTLDTPHILTIGLNGASSFTSIDGGTPVTGDAGAGNPGGLTIGSDGAGANNGAFWYYEIIDRAAADSAATQARIVAGLRSIHGTP